MTCKYFHLYSQHRVLWVAPFIENYVAFLARGLSMAGHFPKIQKGGKCKVNVHRFCKWAGNWHWTNDSFSLAVEHRQEQQVFIFFFLPAGVSFKMKYMLKEWENNEKISSLDMTKLTCDKMNSHESIKTFRVNKVYRAFKKRESFSSTLFIYSKYSPLHPPPSRNGFAVLFTNKKEPQKS